VEEQEARLQVMSEELHNLQRLEDHPGWKMILEYAEGQVGNRIPTALGKLETLLDITGQEYEKGEIAGIQLFVQIPGIVQRDLEEKIYELEKELGYDGAEQTGRTDDGSGSGNGGEGGTGLFEPPV